MSELSNALQGTFMTCENRDVDGKPVYQVRIQAPTLEAAQRVHTALVREGSQHLSDDQTFRAYAVNWTEHERGWGSRPDGHTLHSTPEVAQAYIASVTAGRDYSRVPDDYSAPGEIFVTEVSTEQHLEIIAKGTIWGHVRDNLREP